MEDSLGERVENAERPGILLEILYGLKRVDRNCFCLLADENRLTVDDIADRLDKDRSTVYRAVQRLCEAGFVSKHQVNYDDGGYYHVYTLEDMESIVDDIGDQIDTVSSQMEDLLVELGDEYVDR